MTPPRGSTALSGRWEALDAVRGLTVASMLLVNNPGTWEAVYAPLRHAAWHGWTPTDLIFPFFLFIVGITNELSLERRLAAGATPGEIRRHVVVRGGLIALAGLLLAAFPFFPPSRILGLRIPGVLQRIGVCYAIGALIAWRRSDRVVGAVLAVILLGYWAALTLVVPPGQERATIDLPAETLAAWLDRALLDGHLWSMTKTWDPEGPLSTLPTIATVLAGTLAGRAVRRRDDPISRARWLAVFGIAATGLGLLWDRFFPINKNLWTSSYVVFSAGMVTLLLAAATWLTTRSARWWIGPLLTFGRNPLLAFLGSGLMAKTIGSLIRVGSPDGLVPLQRVIYQRGFASWLPGENGSLAFALVFVGVWYLILRGCELKGWYLKV